MVADREQQAQGPLGQGGQGGQKQRQGRVAAALVLVVPIVRGGPEGQAEGRLGRGDQRGEQQVHARVVQESGKEQGGQKRQSGECPGLVRQAQHTGPQERGVEHEEAAHRRAQEEHRRVVQAGEQVERAHEPEVQGRLVRVGHAVEREHQPLAAQQARVGVGVAHLVGEPQGAGGQGEGRLQGGQRGQGPEGPAADEVEEARRHQTLPCLWNRRWKYAAQRGA